MEPNCLATIVGFILTSSSIGLFFKYIVNNDKSVKKPEKQLDNCAYWWYNDCRK